MEFTVPPSEAGARLDVWLHARLPDLSRSRIQSLIRAGDVTLGARRVSPHTRVQAGASVAVTIPPVRSIGLAAEPVPLDIVWEDRDVVVVNKPPGLVVHPSPGHASRTLVNALLYHCPDIRGVGGELRPGIVHRLDKGTSGVMVAAKNDAALRALAAQFKRGAVYKVYVALVHGVPQPPRGRIESLIGRSRHDRKKMSARPPRGRAAVTHFRLAAPLGPAALLAVRITTGRTHQIRVHLAHRGHPVIGDPQYGSRKQDAALPVVARRPMLHARRLAFRHPRGDHVVSFRAPLPPDMQAVLTALRASGEFGDGQAGRGMP